MMRFTITGTIDSGLRSGPFRVHDGKSKMARWMSGKVREHLYLSERWEEDQGIRGSGGNPQHKLDPDVQP